MQRQRDGIGVALDGLIEGDDEAGDVRALRAGEAEDLAVGRDADNLQPRVRRATGMGLIPNISFVEFDLVLFEQGAQFVLV